MERLGDFLRRTEDNPAVHLLPKVREQIERRRAFSANYGARAANNLLGAANELHIANVRRTRAVLVGLAAVAEKLTTDPTYSAGQAASDAAALRSEYQRLRQDLPRVALRVEDARAIAADPVDYAERQFQKFPALADRIPGLPIL